MSKISLVKSTTRNLTILIIPTPAGIINSIMIHKEYNECVKLHQWLEWRNIKHFHCPNETGGNWARGAMNKKVGVSAGVPDYLIFLNKSQTENGMPLNIAIEMKEPSGKNKATEAQKRWLQTLSHQGFQCAVCYGFQEAKEFIQSLGYYDDGIIPSPKDNPF